MSQLEHVTPQLRITQWDRSRAFYVVGARFPCLDWEHRFEENFPVFAQLTRDGISIFLTEHEGDCKPGGAVYPLSLRTSMPSTKSSPNRASRQNKHRRPLLGGPEK